jgi:1-acyl-sn-glycerol-3-phosphate acyltransferase
VCWVASQLWFRFYFQGRARVPAAGPVLLVANHQSHLDPVLVGIACPRQISALARHSLFFWPLSWLIRSLGAVPIDRQRGSVAGLKTTLRLLRQGRIVLVFPEGTRTPDGQLRNFQPGFCALARRSGATIVPVAISGAFAALPRGRIFPRPLAVRLNFCQPITRQEAAALSDEQLVALVSRQIGAVIEQPRSDQPLLAPSSRNDSVKIWAG